jgi:NADH-quinone oxidoreductase subunit D
MMPPKWVIAFGSCQCSGGIFAQEFTFKGLDELIPVDIYIPGCPPKPKAIEDAFVKLKKLINSRAKQKRRTVQISPFLQTKQKPLIMADESITLHLKPFADLHNMPIALNVRLDGEIIREADVEIGYLHRGIEKFGQNVFFHQFLPYLDRLHYLSAFESSTLYCWAIEKILDLEIPPRAEYIRVLLLELSRIANHLVNFLNLSKALQAQGLYHEITFCIRDFFTLIENCSFQHHQHPSTIGGLQSDIPDEVETLLRDFIRTLPKTLNLWQKKFQQNIVWKERLKGRGIISKDLALQYAISGPNVRASGINSDLRLQFPYRR